MLVQIGAVLDPAGGLAPGRAFKATTGLTPHRYVIHRRVEWAKSLISDTDLTVAEVAAAVGFSNPSHLAHHVRRLLGVSPGALRREGTR